MSTSRPYKLSKIVPNAKLLSIKNFGEILIGCPSEVIKPLIARDRLPEYCVLTLRTMRQGRNLLDIEFLFYMISFYKKDRKKPFHFICTREQKSRIIKLLKESLRGPDFLNLMISLLPEKLPGLLEGALNWQHSPKHNECEKRRAIMAALLERINKLPGLEQAFNKGMAEHLTTERLTRRVSPCFAPLGKILPGWHTRLARAWIQAKLLTRECSYFNSGSDNLEREINKHLKFLIFDKDSLAILKEGKRSVRIHQTEPCYFKIQSGRTVKLEVDMVENEPPSARAPLGPKPFSPPELGATFLGAGTGFAAGKLTTCTIAWIGRKGVAMDVVAESITRMRQLGISCRDVLHVVLTHVHSDHDAGLYQRILEDDRVVLMTTRPIFDSFLRKAEAVTCIPQNEFKRLVDFVELVPGHERAIPGIPNASIRCAYTLHSIPTISVILNYHTPPKAAVVSKNKTALTPTMYTPNLKMSLSCSGDTIFNPQLIQDLFNNSILTPDRRDSLLNFIWDADFIVHEANGAPIHTEVEALTKLPEVLRNKIWLNHIPSQNLTESGLRIAQEGQTVTLIKGKAVDTKNRDLNTLKNSGLFKNLSDKDLQRLYNAGRVVKRQAGAAIIKQGEVDDTFYIILSGMAVAEKNGKIVNEYKCRDFFGELAIVTPSRTRQASVMAQTEMRLFTMPSSLRHDYNLPQFIEPKLYLLENFFSEYTAPSLLISLAAGKMQSFMEDTEIIHLGSRARHAYILISGQVEALDSKGKRLWLVEEMEIFGGLEVLHKLPRVAAIRTLSEVKVLRFSAAQLDNILKKSPSFYATIMQKIRGRLRGNKALKNYLRDNFRL